MARLLVVHHTPSPGTHAMLESVRSGATDRRIRGVDVVVRPALQAAVSDVLAADGYLLGTPANLGYMSGALKHFFDQIYYPCLDATAGRPYGMWIHGNTDTAGARSGIERIVAGLRWSLAQPPLEVRGDPGAEELAACWELGAALAAGVSLAEGG